MSVRADWALERQLELTAEQAQHDEVKAAIAAVLQHLNSGKSRQRRGGRALVRLVQDALDYCEGQAFKPEFEEQGGSSLPSGRTSPHGNFWRNSPQRPPTAKFAEAPDDRPGRYRIVRGKAELARWLERVLRDRIDVEDPAEAARTVVTSPEALALLADEENAQVVLRAAELKGRRQVSTKCAGPPRIPRRRSSTCTDCSRRTPGSSAADTSVLPLSVGSPRATSWTSP